MKVTFKTISNTILEPVRFAGRVFGGHLLERVPKQDVFVPTENFIFKQLGSQIKLIDETGQRKCRAIISKEFDHLHIPQLDADVSSKGYGTRMLDYIANKYLANGSFENITLNAMWKGGIETIPHIFYLKRGFVAADTKTQKQLLNWIKKGAKFQDFPVECDGCKMILTRENYLKSLQNRLSA